MCPQSIKHTIIKKHVRYRDRLFLHRYFKTVKRKVMTNYENDTLALLNGDTPKQRYETLKNIMILLDCISTPARGSEAENWTSYDIAQIIEKQNLLTKPQD